MIAAVTLRAEFAPPDAGKPVPLAAERVTTELRDPLEYDFRGAFEAAREGIQVDGEHRVEFVAPLVEGSKLCTYTIGSITSGVIEVRINSISETPITTRPTGRLVPSKPAGAR